MSGLADLTTEELEARLETASREYRARLGGGYFHTESSLTALRELEPLVLERSRRNQLENERIAEERRLANLVKTILQIQARRPLNPTPDDIPLFEPDTYQKVVKQVRGWAIIRTNTWDLYEFDLYLWAWVRRDSRSRRADILVRYESEVSEPTQEDIDFNSRVLDERRREVEDKLGG